MVYDTGGWTLIEDDASGGGGTGPQSCSAGIVTQSSCAYMPTNTVRALGNISTRVHSRFPVVPNIQPVTYVTSVNTPNAAPIANLRLGNVFNLGVPTNNTAVQQSYWTVSAGLTLSIFNFSADPSAFGAWPNVYYANGNSAGFNVFGPTTSQFTSGAPGSEIETYAQ
jgi:hypothetical protein